MRKHGYCQKDDVNFVVFGTAIIIIICSQTNYKSAVTKCP